MLSLTKYVHGIKVCADGHRAFPKLSSKVFIHPTYTSFKNLTLWI